MGDNFGLNMNKVWAQKALDNPTLPTYVTPDSLLVYCQTRLRDLDTRIQERFATEQKNIKVLNAINNLKDVIRGAAQDGISASEKNAILAQIETIKGMTDDPNLQSRLDNVGALVDEGMDAQKAADGPIKSLDDIGKDIGSDRELSMIELQSVVSQRQTALQLTTNLMNAINQSAQAIAQNIK